MGDALVGDPFNPAHLREVYNTAEKRRMMKWLHVTRFPIQFREGLGALARGASQQAAAMSCGVSVAEWRYVLLLGKSGHPAWAEFYSEVLRVRGDRLTEVHEKNYRVAVEDGDVAHLERAESVILGGTLQKAVADNQRAIVQQNFHGVEVRKDFDEVVDAEVAE